MKTPTISTRNTRTGDARKIDEWSVTLQDGKRSIFHVHLAYIEDEVRFTVTGTDDRFRKLKLHSTDLTDLKDLLNRHIAELTDNENSQGWDEGFLLSSSWNTRSFRGEDGDRHFTLDLNLSPVMILRDQKIGNMGETTIRTRMGQSVVIQRAMTDDFSSFRPKSGRLTDPEVIAFMNSPIRDEATDGPGRSRIAMPQDIRAADDLIDVLEDFSARLAERLSYTATSIQGMMRPEELSELMCAAVEAAGQPSDPDRG